MLTLIVKFLVKPDQLVAFKQALNTNRLGSQNEPGMREMRFFQGKDSPNTIFAGGGSGAAGFVCFVFCAF